MRPGCVTTPPALREEEKSSHKHKSDCRQCPDCPLSSRYRSSRELHTAEPKKKKVLFSGPKPFQDLGCIFFLFVPVGGPLLILILKNRPQLPTPRNALTKATVLYIGSFFFSSTAKDPASSQPSSPSCPFLRTLQYQRDWRKKKAKNELYTPPYSYKDAVLDSSGGREIGFFFMTPPALAELQVAAAAAAVAALVMVVVTPYFHSLRH